jgi:hypothetical protein
MEIRIPTFFHIAPVAANITTPNSYEIGCFSCIVAFSLDGVKLFHQWQQFTFYKQMFLIWTKAV